MYRTSRLTHVGADSGGLFLLRLCFLQMIWFLWPPWAAIFSSHWDSLQSNRAKMKKKKSCWMTGQLFMFLCCISLCFYPELWPWAVDGVQDMLADLWCPPSRSGDDDQEEWDLSVSVENRWINGHLYDGSRVFLAPVFYTVLISNQWCWLFCAFGIYLHLINLKIHANFNATGYIITLNLMALYYYHF